MQLQVGLSCPDLFRISFKLDVSFAMDIQVIEQEQEQWYTEASNCP